MKQYIGRYEVKKINDNEDNTYTVDFRDKEQSSMVINKDLFNIIARKVKNEGDVYDMIRLMVGAKFVTEMADYGLTFQESQGIAMGMQALLQNARESAISKVFEVGGTDDIPVKKLTDHLV